MQDEVVGKVRENKRKKSMAWQIEIEVQEIDFFSSFFPYLVSLFWFVMFVLCWFTCFVFCCLFVHFFYLRAVCVCGGGGGGSG